MMTSVSGVLQAPMDSSEERDDLQFLQLLNYAYGFGVPTTAPYPIWIGVIKSSN